MNSYIINEKKDAQEFLWYCLNQLADEVDPILKDDIPKVHK